METTGARLTDLAIAGGCAAKYPAARLEELLAGFLPAESENLLVGLAPTDDAAVYRLDDERALIFTVDFFPPLVDDPDDFGTIAATNALNDVFAMGGVPILALSVAAFPEELAGDAVAAILAAADRTVRDAGALLAGGHTIRDAEPKYGLAVIGTVRPDGVWRKSDAIPGDALFLTKPLGTGLVLAGVKNGILGEEEKAAAVAQMRTLNRAAAEMLLQARPGAVTDVTGFGLFGHAVEVAERSERRASHRGRAPARACRARSTRRSTGSAPVATRRTASSPRAGCGSRGSVPSSTCSASIPRRRAGMLVSLPAEHGAALEAEFRAARPLSRPHRTGRGGCRRPRALADPSIETVLARLWRRRVSPRGFSRIATISLAEPPARRRDRSGRPADRIRARLRELAALWRQAVPGARVSRVRRVRQPRRRARGDHSRRRDLAGLPPGRRSAQVGVVRWPESLRSERSRRSRSAVSRSSSTSIRLRS